jgi:hypothetical protein
MSNLEQTAIIEITELFEHGYITPYELDWCLGAIRNRHDLTDATRLRLRESVQDILRAARTRFEVASK